MVKKEKKGKGKNGYVVDNVDTTSLTLKQLQTFCEKVYQEIVKTELESRSLELERNKLKTMVELSTQELIRAKANKREKETELGQTNEAIICDALELQKQIRNVRNEKSKELTLSMAVVDNNLQSLQRDSDQCRATIEKDMQYLRSRIVGQDNNKNRKSTVLKQELEQEKSNLFNSHDNDCKLQTARYEKQMSEMSTKLKKQYTQKAEEFNEYKVRKINEFLNANDKMNVSLQHYYEKLLQRNMTVLDGMHENYKLVKDDVKQLQSTLKIHKEDETKNNLEIETNNMNIKELSNKLANSESDQWELKATKKKLILSQNKLKNKQWDNLFLEEALFMMKKEGMKVFKQKESIFFSLESKVGSEILKLECVVGKIRKNLNTMNNIIESHEHKDNQKLRMSVLQEIIFTQLEKEAVQEEKQKIKNEFSSQTN